MSPSHSWCHKDKRSSEIFSVKVQSIRHIFGLIFLINLSFFILSSHSCKPGQDKTYYMPLQTAKSQISLCTTLNLSRVMRKPMLLFPTWSETNRAVKSLHMARGLKFRI